MVELAGQYQKCLVTFVDMLGFSELVRKDPTGRRVARAFSKFRMYSTEDLWGQGRARGARFWHFSDCVLRVTPLDAGDAAWERNFETIVQEIEELTYIQGELASQEVMLRGGIAVGEAFADENGAFGPAIIDAYLTEAKVATFPRIVLHSSAIGHLTRGSGPAGPVRAPDGLCLTRFGDDGLQYIDYIKNFPREVHDIDEEEPDETVVSYAVPRKVFIERQLAARADLDAIRVKYMWLARYHNDVIRDRFGASRPELEVELSVVVD